MKKRVEKVNKISVGIIILIFSVYFSTAIHETGHQIAYIINGCKIPIVYVSTFIIGYATCIPHSFFDNLTRSQDILNSLSGFILATLIGILFYMLYKKSKFIKDHYPLLLFFYFSSITLIANGFLQSLSSSDVHSLVVYLGVNPLYFVILGIILGIILIFQVSDFKNILKQIEPSVSDEKRITLTKIWAIIFLLYTIIYFSQSFIYKLF